MNRFVPLQRMNDYGWFRPSLWLYLCLLLLCRTWVLFVAAAASRESGSELLELFYPRHWHFYIGLGLGLPALVLLWLQGLRHRFAWIGSVWRHGYAIVVTTLIADIALQLWQFTKHPHPFSAAIILLLSFWSLLYLLKSNSSRIVFSHQGTLVDEK